MERFMRIRAIIILVIFSVSFSYAGTPWSYGQYSNAIDEHNIAFSYSMLDDIEYTIGSRKQEVEFAFIRAEMDRISPYLDLNFSIVLIDTTDHRLAFDGEYSINFTTSDNRVWETRLDGWGFDYLSIYGIKSLSLRDLLISSDSVMVTITKDNLKITFSLTGDNFIEVEKKVFDANKPLLFNTWYRDTSVQYKIFGEDINNPNRFMKLVTYVGGNTIKYMISFYEALQNGYSISGNHLDWGNMMAFRMFAGNEFVVSIPRFPNSLYSVFFEESDLSHIRRVLLTPKSKKLEFYFESKQIFALLLEDAEGYIAIDSELQERLK